MLEILNNHASQFFIIINTHVCTIESHYHKCIPHTIIQFVVLNTSYKYKHP